MPFCKWYVIRPFLKRRSHFTTTRFSSVTLWFSRCPQWWIQMGQCSLSAQMWDPLQGHWEMLHSVDSLKSWSKCWVSSTRKPVTWRRRRWVLLITCSESSWLHNTFQFIAVVLYKPKSADMKNSCFHCLIIWTVLFYYRANWMIIKSERIMGSVSTMISWWVHFVEELR